MADRSNALPVVALIIGIVGIGLGGYAIIGDLTQPNLPKARVFLGSAFNLAIGSNRKINFTSVSFDSHNAFNLANHTYTVPEEGYYSIDAQFCTGAYGGDFFAIGVYRSGDYVLRGGISKGGTIGGSYSNFLAVPVSGIVKCNANDQLYVFGYFYNASGTTTRPLFADEAYTYLSIAKLQ